MKRDFYITEAEFHKNQPNGQDIDRILAGYHSSCGEIETVLKNKMFSHERNSGFQMELAEQLKALFVNFFSQRGIASAYTGGYSREVEFVADAAFQNPNMNRKVTYLEIEFRPQECNDLIKFQIGFHRNLELGILLVAKNRNHINSAYTTMPEFSKCRKLLDALAPVCPVLLIGIDGRFKLQAPSSDQNIAPPSTIHN